MNLNPGTKIGRYEIRSLIGAGGMGEVYRAFDTKLEREIALKFLKHTDDAEKLRRFRQEAKAISALNHPNILTIYEVGEYKHYHFIVSELVGGENLRDIIKNKNLPLAEILDIAVQIGNALASAHRLGIVHRDIKPENIMILPDGYVKVLDFGLAKFVGLEKSVAHDSEAETASLVQTKAGMILGTVNYMSPEQLRGKTVDERTDMWSLGVVLFEMLVRRRPFTGESASDVIAAVLEHDAPTLSESDANFPDEIQAIVGKALKKEADDRFQSAREFVEALKSAKSRLESGSYTAAVGGASSNSFHSQKTFFTNADRITSAGGENLSGLFIAGTRIRWHIIALLGGVLVLAAGIGGWFYLRQAIANKPLDKQKKTRRITTTESVANAAISPDGHFVVFAQNNPNGQQSLWLRQIDGTALKELIPASQKNYAGLTFAPDGNWIYYTAFESNGIGRLCRIQMLGSAPQEIARDADSTISFAPDGKSFAFIRANPNEGVDRIIVSTVDGSERILSERKRPEFYTTDARQSPAWSPDGKFIACPFGRIDPDSEFMSVIEINVESGEQKPLTPMKWNRVGSVVWTRNADELLITAADAGSESFQIVKIYRGSGRSQNVTGELKDYYNLSLSADATRLLTVAYDRTSSIYTASSDELRQSKQIEGGIYDGIGGVRWTTDGKIIYVSTESGNRDIWAMDVDGANRRQLTTDAAADDSPDVSADGQFIVFVSSRNGTPHIWRMNQNGTDLKQLTNRGGENFPVITPDGGSVIYSSRTGGRPVLWKTSIEGGEPTQLTTEQTNWSAIAPDGKTIACLTRGDTFESPTQLAFLSSETGAFLKMFKPSGIISAPNLPTVIRWMPDDQSAAYVADVGGVSNIWMQPLKGGEPKQVTEFTAGKIFAFDWSKDGKRIVYARGSLRNDLVLIEDF